MSAFLYFKPRDGGGYPVVYLSTGEVYVGKLTTTPVYTLSESYISQVVKDSSDPSKNSFQSSPVREVMWAPRRLYLNERHVIFHGPILPDSHILVLPSRRKGNKLYIPNVL